MKDFSSLDSFSIAVAFSHAKFRVLHARSTLKGYQLAEAVGVDPARISKWKKNVQPEPHYIVRIAKALNVSPSDLMDDSPASDQPRHTGTGESDAEPYDRDISRGYRKDDVPVVGDAEASANGFIVWDSDGVVRGQVEMWVSRSFADGDPKAYALRVRNDSMAPRYHHGEIVVAQPRLRARDGDYAVVILTSGERLVKRVFRVTGGWRLHSENPLFGDRQVREDQVAAIHPIRHAMTPPRAE